MPQLNAFVARSFLPDDERRLEPILRFLETFKKIGFLCRHAEAAEVESVSVKVRALIDKSDVFIGIFTKRHPVYAPPIGFLGAWRSLRGILPAASIWTAPAWVLQESGYALQKLGPTKLILLRETDVEIPGLQGDLEYVPFVPERPAEVFSKLSEMIHDLLAQASGVEVRTFVTERLVDAQAATEPPPVVPESEPPADEPEDSDIVALYIRMTDAAKARDYEGMSQAWTKGAELIEQGKVEQIDRLVWDCFYYEGRFRAGVADGLEALRNLEAQNPSRLEPSACIARCLRGSEEYQDSARSFLKAAQLAKDQARVDHLLDAARAFREAKQFSEGKNAALEALAIARDENRTEALGELYQLFKADGETYLAFATGEAALHENPQAGLRFGLGLDYHRRDLDELGLLHFKFLHERDKDDAAVLHNLALMLADCKLPISAAKHYKTAIDLGETLSAANLGYIYLDAGIADDARIMIEKAMELEEHAPRLEKCLAEIVQRTEDEEVKEKNLLRSARENRDLLVLMGRALYALTPTIQGKWKFPFGEMTLLIDSGSVSGEAEFKTEQSPYGSLANLLGGITSPTGPKTESYSIGGKLTGGVCQFKLTVTDRTPRAPRAINALSVLHEGAGTSKSGFLVFEADGKTALYAELADQKLGEFQTITRVG